MGRAAAKRLRRRPFGISRNEAEICATRREGFRLPRSIYGAWRDLPGRGTGGIEQRMDRCDADQRDPADAGHHETASGNARPN